MNQAKIRVRATILALHQFTVDDLVRTTGLNLSSIHSELHRLKREGLVRVVDEATGEKPRVGVPKRYAVVAEPDKLRRLTESIESFRIPSDPSSPERPVSTEFKTLQQTLDLALLATPEQRTELLRDGERLYQAAVEAEIATVAPESVQSYLRFERARLSYLTGDYNRAERIFRALQPVLTRLGDSQTAALVDDYCVGITYRREAQQVAQRTLVAAAEELIDDVQQSSGLSANPLAVLLTEVLQKTVTRLREVERLAAAAAMQTRLRRPTYLDQGGSHQFFSASVAAGWGRTIDLRSTQHTSDLHLPPEPGVSRATAMAALAKSKYREFLDSSEIIESINDVDDRRRISFTHQATYELTPDTAHPQSSGAGILIVDNNWIAEHLHQTAVRIGPVILSSNWDVPIEESIRQVALSQFGDTIRALGLSEGSLGEDTSVEVVVSAQVAERWQP